MKHQLDEHTKKYMRFIGHHIVVLSVASGDSREYRMYGPFTNGAESKAWMDAQYDAGFNGTFGIIPLRTPDRTRPHANDWWMSDMHQSREWMEAEYPHSDWSVFPAPEVGVK